MNRYTVVVVPQATERRYSVEASDMEEAVRKCAHSHKNCKVVHVYDNKRLSDSFDEGEPVFGPCSGCGKYLIGEVLIRYDEDFNKFCIDCLPLPRKKKARKSK